MADQRVVSGAEGRRVGGSYASGMDQQRADRQLRQIAEIAEEAARLGVAVWLRGGWAMDFFLGHTTRDHEDIDWFAWAGDARHGCPGDGAAVVVGQVPHDRPRGRRARGLWGDDPDSEMPVYVHKPSRARATQSRRGPALSRFTGCRTCGEPSLSRVP